MDDGLRVAQAAVDLSQVNGSARRNGAGPSDGARSTLITSNPCSIRSSTLPSPRQATAAVTTTRIDTAPGASRLDRYRPIISIASSMSARPSIAMCAVGDPPAHNRRNAAIPGGTPPDATPESLFAPENPPHFLGPSPPSGHTAHKGSGEGDLDHLVRAVGDQVLVPPECLEADPDLEDTATSRTLVQDRQQLCRKTASL